MNQTNEAARLHREAAEAHREAAAAHRVAADGYARSGLWMLALGLIVGVGMGAYFAATVLS